MLQTKIVFSKQINKAVKNKLRLALTEFLNMSQSDFTIQDTNLEERKKPRKELFTKLRNLKPTKKVENHVNWKDLASATFVLY